MPFSTSLADTAELASLHVSPRIVLCPLLCWSFDLLWPPVSHFNYRCVIICQVSDAFESEYDTPSFELAEARSAVFRTHFLVRAKKSVPSSNYSNLQTWWKAHSLHKGVGSDKHYSFKWGLMFDTGCIWACCTELNIYYSAFKQRRAASR